MSEKGERESIARAELVSALKEHLPNTLENLFIAALIWLFGALVFLPAATRITSVEAPLVIALILLIAFTLFIFKASGGLHLLLPVASEIFAHKYIQWKKGIEKPTERMKERFRCTIYVLAVLILYTSYLPFLLPIHPSLAGLAFIPIVLWIFLMILKIIA